MLMRQRVQRSNALRGHMALFGIVAPIGRRGLETLVDPIVHAADDRVPSGARACLQMLFAQLQVVNMPLLENDRRIIAGARASEVGRRLMAMPGSWPRRSADC